MITIEKLYHNDVTHIAIRFGYDKDIKRKIKTIGARYTKTHGCWYIPYSADHYRRFKQLELPYCIADDTLTTTRGTTDGPSSKSDHTAISSNTEEQLVAPPHQGKHRDANIRSKGSDHTESSRESSCKVSSKEQP